MPNLGRPRQYGTNWGGGNYLGDMIYSRFSRYKYIHTDRFDIRHGPSRVACTECEQHLSKIGQELAIL
jgi:hypothetical protein